LYFWAIFEIFYMVVLAMLEKYNVNKISNIQLAMPPEPPERQNLSR
jgi:hypothetical protein